MIRNAVSHGIAAFNLAEGRDPSTSSHFVGVAAFLGEFGNRNM
jgi:hypothetical protein